MNFERNKTAKMISAQFNLNERQIIVYLHSMAPRRQEELTQSQRKRKTSTFFLKKQ